MVFGASDLTPLQLGADRQLQIYFEKSKCSVEFRNGQYWEEKDKKQLGQSESVAGGCEWGHENKTFPDRRRLNIMTKKEAGEALMDSGAKE